MNPAPSVIIFTTLSGLGFGILVWLGIQPHPPVGWNAFWLFLLAYALSVGGLLASTFHLGHPERAMLAFTQWRSSWLSREGICAVAALLVMALYGLLLVFFQYHIPIIGWAGALLSIGTVYTTSMIYTQLATVPRWNTLLTPVLYLTYAFTGGALVMAQDILAMVLLVCSSVVQILWWHRGDEAFAVRGSDLGTATGLGNIGKVRSLAHPHTSPNYLMQEFIYVVGRKHVQKLRIISLIMMALLPAILLLFSSSVLPFVALLLHIVGVAISRWLFFAEAEHTVGLYYGMR